MVTNSMLKQLPSHCVNHLVVIFNSALRLQHFPDVWKYANVVTIPKPGKDPKIPSNRRPISLLSSLGKIYERILLKRLTCHVSANNLVPEEQFGFMPGCSTTQQLLRLTEAISAGLDRKWTTIAVFLDISKAYDSAWHTGLVYKLIHMGLPGELIKVIDSYLAHRAFRVRMDGAVSEWKPMLAGVPQGSTLSPMLYNLYTSDIPKSTRTELAVYADDICIYNQHKSVRFAHLAVQRHLNEIGRWAAEWRIKISAEKTKAVIFSKKTRLQLPELRLQNADIEYVPRIRYLGVVLDHKLNWTSHCEVLRGKALRTLTAMKPVMRTSLSIKTKLLLYKSYIRPVMTYAAPAWAFIPKTKMERLQIVQNRALRLIGGYSRYTRINKMHFDLEIPRLKTYIKSLATKLYASAKYSRNRYIRKLGADSSVYNQRVLRPFHILS